MNDTTNVAILGAGAMGAALAAQFYKTPEYSVTLIAKDERYARLKEHGLTVNGIHLPISVTHPDHAPGTADVIIVALKHRHLAEAIEDLRHFVGAETSILSVMNGLDSEVMLGEAYGMEHVLYCIAVGMDAVRNENQVTYAHLGKLCFGEALNPSTSPRVKRVQAILERAGIVYETPPDMIRLLWWKFMVNVGVNQASAVMRAPYGVFHTNPDARAVMFALMREAVALAQCAGVNLTEADLAGWDNVLQNLSPSGKTSMLQDIEAGRQTEVEIFAGKVVALGQTYGVPTPVNETILHIIRALEFQANVHSS